MSINKDFGKDNIPFKAIDWNNIEDPKDKEIWDRLTNNFWLDSDLRRY